MQIEILAVRALRPYPRNARTHSKKQIRQIANSIQRFGFTNPILVDDENRSLRATAGCRPQSCLASKKCQQ